MTDRKLLNAAWRAGVRAAAGEIALRLQEEGPWGPQTLPGRICREVEQRLREASDRPEKFLEERHKLPVGRKSTLGGIRHVYPLGDTMKHDTESEACPCCPRIEDLPEGRVVVHHAMDGRE